MLVVSNRAGLEAAETENTAFGRRAARRQCIVSVPAITRRQTLVKSRL